MKNWRTEKALYHIVEITKSSKEEYNMLMTGEEIKEWCKTKREFYGYVPGIGGDRSYECVAWLIEAE